ncbi:L-glyceraldehyde 3-phosphate reductase [Leifsonia sp. 98AMF]|uniref:aldo/keto reductase n=1 Tax=unclassified Leifsonia TaxID=2663824 RepID=UPI00087D3DCA|nr:MULTISPECIES: aldo/keto reductase [unclassified Leifsonia]SDH09741.1 L-glyceraldehyde 3-phosphate reductase [Leifsonia sp. 197AMF]SDJ29521.1 L-glyceraldehyde 3-phosphate reductase [Leifsonia sp. 466MF]SDK51033.1 L-glyceraldehyde 3-phosphate reductase [Leifsonia sp. 157MF]SDN51321.1 L-glyceraldehyde 3-phosphate reductase [Leifsonia sp. 509MF]SEN58900.1 L-glyceraldehyde 3-phosphate reductase [Leifsonia sp. 467MF]
MTFVADPARYDSMPYRRAGRSGLLLPPLSLGLWQNFGSTRSFETQRAIVLRAFDAGITHFDLANNYGPPPGAAEEVFGRILATDLKAHRDEIVVSTKAGYLMWPGPYGDHGSRKYLLSSLDQSLTRLGLDYVDVFYHHRPDLETPLEESMGALTTAVERGKALYPAISNYGAERTTAAAALLAGSGTPLLLHQPRYSLFDRSPENGVLDAVEQAGAAAIVFSPLAQGLLTDRYLGGVPEGSRAVTSAFLHESDLTEDVLTRVRALNDIAAGRGQTLAQLALQWVLRSPVVVSAIIGASSVQQLEQNLGALDGPELTGDVLAAIDAALG